ncbi:hypothetical protein [Sphingomonas sp. LY160]|uniref:hypothetical protein n=1 Tax=Sphingomonas sp. LY160 TaxID=3095342 RepID=UPI002ADEB42A|nr:hypothetical protein [Sphingomonas sp. LY160]MEA1071305.1 hypothetical protein [Sphingomonas sp. LY160]
MKSIPHWPASMKLALAASYCDLSPTAFQKEVAAGILPMPFELGGVEHWTKASIDRALAVMTGEDESDWRKNSPLYRDVA